MATEFICSIKSAAGDYVSLQAWDTAIASDLTASANKVFSHGGITGSITDGQSGYCSSGEVTVYHATQTQIYVFVVSGEINSGDTISTASGSVTVSNSGDSVIAVAECDNFNQNASCTLATGTWTTTATNCIRIRPASGQERTTGTNPLQVGHAPRIDVASGAALLIQVANVYITGMDFRARTNANVVITWAADNVNFDDCIAEYQRDSVAWSTLLCSTDSINASFRNCIFTSSRYVMNSTGIRGYNNFYNCIFIAGLTGFGNAVREYASGDGYVNVENCYASAITNSEGVGQSYVITRGTKTNCAAHDSGGTSDDLDNIPPESVFRVVAMDGTEDYRLRTDVTKNELLGSGIVGSGSPTNDGNYPNAIDGTTRALGSDSVWDIGPWQESESQVGSTSASTSLSSSASTSVSTSVSTSASSSLSSSASTSVSSSASTSASTSASSSASTYTLAPPTDLYSNEGSAGAQLGQTNPTGITDTTPVFSAIVYPNAVSITDVWIQVSKDPTFAESSLEWDSGWLTLGEEIGPSAPDRIEDITYGQS